MSPIAWHVPNNGVFGWWNSLLTQTGDATVFTTSPFIHAFISSLPFQCFIECLLDNDWADRIFHQLDDVC